AYRTYLPAMLPERRLLEGNAKIGMTGAIAEIGGPGFAGILVQLITAPMAILVDAVSYVVSAVSIAAIRLPERIVEHVEGPAGRRAAARRGHVPVHPPALRRWAGHDREHRCADRPATGHAAPPAWQGERHAPCPVGRSGPDRRNRWCPDRRGGRCPRRVVDLIRRLLGRYRISRLLAVTFREGGCRYVASARTRTDCSPLVLNCALSSGSPRTSVLVL